MLSYKSSRYQPVALPPERGSQRLHARRPRSCAFPPAPRGGESESSAPTVAALRSSGDIIASAKFSLTWSILVVNSLWLCLMSAESCETAKESESGGGIGHHGGHHVRGHLSGTDHEEAHPSAQIS